jgi:hypothetical protein
MWRYTKPREALHMSGKNHGVVQIEMGVEKLEIAF